MADVASPTIGSYDGSPFEAKNRELLAQAVDLTDDEVVGEFVPAHPQLLNAYVVQHEFNRMPEADRVEQNRAYSLLAMLDQLRHFVEGNPERYPLGRGPIEPIWTSAIQRRISRAEAVRQVTAPAFGWGLSGAYLRALCRFANRLVQDDTRRNDGWELQELLLSAVQALPPVGDPGELGRSISADFAFMYGETGCDWLLAATPYLRAVPDGRLYHRAQAIAADLVDRFRTANHPQGAARALYRVASLGTEPFVGLPADQDGMRQVLRRRFVGAQADGGVDEPDWSLVDWPLAADAMALSQRQFCESAKLRSGHERGIALTASFHSLLGLRHMGQTVHDDEILTVARDALSELDPAQAEREILSIRTDLAQAGLRVDNDSTGPGGRKASEQLGPSSAEPHTAAFELELQRAHSAGLVLPEVALGTLVRLHEHAEKLGADTRERLWSEELRQLAGLVRRGSARRDGFLRRRTRPPLVAIGAAVDQAFVLQREEQEEKALVVMAKAVRKNPLDPTWHRLDEALRFLELNLLIGAAVGAVTVNPAHSVQRYAAALVQAGCLRLHGTAADLLRRIGWLARDTRSHEVAEEVCLGLLPSCREFIASTPQVRYEYYRTCQLAFAAAATSGTNEVTADLLRQMIKGLSFAVAVQQRARYTVQEDAGGQTLLAELADLEIPDDADSGTADAPLLTEDALLTTYVNSREVRPGAGRAERTANVQRVFDERLFDQLTSGEAGDYAMRLAGALRHDLDGRTVLLDLLLGLDTNQELVIYTWVHTSDGVHLMAVRNQDLPGLADWLGDDREILVHPLADEVRSVRALLQDYPGPGRAVSREAEDALRSMAVRLFGGEAGEQDILDLAESGRDRLIIVPHGPLHFLPFHLLPLQGRLLADLFTVTVLPNRELLDRRRPGTATPAQAATRPATALGLSFADGIPGGLAPLPDSAREVRGVATAFGTPPLLDTAATAAAFRHAVQHSRYVHLSTHGRNTSAGAAFQLLYLWPHEASDGRLHAYELLDLDLARLEILSLSACETALGRFDLLDNLRGLPASFLLRGVRTLIGTLWDAEVAASRTFFTSFYHTVGRDPGDVAAAFRHAQDTTRQAHPEYRDWGAFYLMGAI